MDDKLADPGYGQGTHGTDDKGPMVRTTRRRTHGTDDKGPMVQTTRRRTQRHVAQVAYSQLVAGGPDLVGIFDLNTDHHNYYHLLSRSRSLSVEAQ